MSSLRRCLPVLLCIGRFSRARIASVLWTIRTRLCFAESSVLQGEGSCEKYCGDPPPHSCTAHELESRFFVEDSSWRRGISNREFFCGGFGFKSLVLWRIFSFAPRGFLRKVCWRGGSPSFTAREPESPSVVEDSSLHQGCLFPAATNVCNFFYVGPFIVLARILSWFR